MNYRLLLLSISMLALTMQAQTAYQPSSENLHSRAEFADMKFGIFIHWGIYSVYGQGEWYLNNGNLDLNEYAKAADAFYPHRFDAKAWVDAIKDSGAKYVTFTSRHHDSFSMWHTQQSAYNIVDATPYGRDIVGQLATACHDGGLRLHLYYSLLDWIRPEYALGVYGHGIVGRDTLHANYPAYLDFMKGQLTELLTQYGDIGAIWLDGEWDHAKDQVPFDWQLNHIYDLVHRLQPSCLVGNNHHTTMKAGEDIQIFERDVPGENKGGFSEGQAVNAAYPLETCQTMNTSWGYNVGDQHYKSTRELLHLLIRTAGKGANLLLNIGPQPDGQLPAMALQRLKEMGVWLRRNGESIYGTTAGPISETDWGVSTRRGNVVYLHVLNNQITELQVDWQSKARRVTTLDGQRLDYKQTKGHLVITLPMAESDAISRIIKIED